jgi:hypothetical protein
MSAERRAVGVLIRLAAMCGLVYGMAVAAEEAPEMDFLEYLGSWEESDEDWLLFDENDGDKAKTDDTRSDPAPTGEESTENDDEN